MLTVHQLQQDLSKKNMFFSKDLIELSKVVGQGEYVCSTRYMIKEVSKVVRCMGWNMID